VYAQDVYYFVNCLLQLNNQSQAPQIKSLLKSNQLTTLFAYNSARYYIY